MRRGIGSVVAVCCAALLALLVSSPRADAAASPSSGPPGTTFTASFSGNYVGEGGVPSGTVTLQGVTSVGAGAVPGCNFNVPVTVPLGTKPGTYSLTFSASTGDCNPSEVTDGSFTVTKPVVDASDKTSGGTSGKKDNGGGGSHSSGTSTAAPVTTTPEEPDAEEQPKEKKPKHDQKKQETQQNSDQPGATPPPGSSPPPSSNEKQTSFASSLIKPSDVPFDAKDLANSAVLAMLLTILIAVPITIFNESMDETFATFSDRFPWLSGALDSAKSALPAAIAALLPLLASILVGMAIYVFLEPGFPDIPGVGSYLLGVFAGVAVVTGISWATWLIFIRVKARGATGSWLVFGPFVLLSAILVIVSRLLSFLPGLVLGTLADYKTSEKLSTERSGQRVAFTYVVALIIGLAAWFGWAAIDDNAAQPGAGFGTVVADTALALIFVSCMQGLVFSLLPVKFLNGYSLYSWSKPVWLALWGFGMLWCVHLIIQPALGTYSGSGVSLGWAIVALGISSLVAAGAWWTINERKKAKTA